MKKISFSKIFIIIELVTLFIPKGGHTATFADLVNLMDGYITYVENEITIFTEQPAGELDFDKSPINLEPLRAGRDDRLSTLRELQLRINTLGNLQDDPARFRSGLRSVLHDVLLGRLMRLQLIDRQRKRYYVEDAAGVLKRPSTMPFGAFFETFPEVMNVMAEQPNSSRYRLMMSHLTDYQFFNMAINTLIDLLPIEAIHGDIELYIRVSPSLHRLIRGYTDELGYPEEAYLLENYNGTNDVTLYLLYAIQNWRSVPDVMLGGSKKMKLVNCTYAEYLQLTGGAIRIPPLPRIDWLYSRKSHPPEPASGASLVSSQAQEVALPLQAIISADTLAPVEEQGVEHLACPVISAAAALEKAVDARKADTPEQGASRTIMGSVSVDSDSGTQQSGTQQDDESCAVDSWSSVLPTADVKALSAVDVPDDSRKGKTAQKIVPQKVVRRKAMACASHAAAAAAASANVGYTPSRGNRLFHSQRPVVAVLSSQELTARLNSRDLAWLTGLLTHASREVSFKDFQRVWKAFNGERSIVESGGTSHRPLKNSDGVIIGGVFAVQKCDRAYQGLLRGVFAAVGITEASL